MEDLYVSLAQSSSICWGHFAQLFTLVLITRFCGEADCGEKGERQKMYKHCITQGCLGDFVGK